MNRRPHRLTTHMFRKIGTASGVHGASATQSRCLLCANGGHWLAGRASFRAIPMGRQSQMRSSPRFRRAVGWNSCPDLGLPSLMKASCRKLLGWSVETSRFVIPRAHRTTGARITHSASGAENRSRHSNCFWALTSGRPIDQSGSLISLNSLLDPLRQAFRR